MNVFFIVVGVFVGFEDIVFVCVGKYGIGFGVLLYDKGKDFDLFSEVLLEDLYKFGLILEFIGCFFVVMNVLLFD